MPSMYLLHCADGTTYVGSTIDLDRRLAQHQPGEGAAYTRNRRPVRLIHVEEFARIDDAFAREKQVQNWSRAKRLALARGDEETLSAASRKQWRQVSVRSCVATRPPTPTRRAAWRSRRG